MEEKIDKSNPSRTDVWLIALMSAALVSINIELSLFKPGGLNIALAIVWSCCFAMHLWRVLR